jgi:hypothetical protein
MSKFVTLYGKDGCGKCEAAIEKLKMFKERGVIPGWEKVDFDSPGPDWRDTHLPAAMAHYQFTDTLPVIEIKGEMMSYPEAMRRVKIWEQKSKS